MTESPESLSRRGTLSALALFLAGFVLISFLLHLTLRDPLRLHADMRSEKLIMLDRLQGSVFSAAFGSSHVHNGFAPAVFDHELTEGSAPALHTQTINLAVEGGSQAEQRILALEFVHHLQAPPRGESCMVLLELNAGANFLNNYLVHPRTIDIYDWHTARFVSTLTTTGMPLTQRFGRIGYALAASGLHYINLGMLSNKIFAPPLDQAMLADELAQDRRGQKIEPPQPNDVVLTAKLAAYPKSSTPIAELLTPGSTILPQEIEAASPVKNLAFVYFVYPKLTDVSGPLDYPDHLNLPGSGQAGRDIPIIDLARPDLFPQLYQPRYWHDEAHLNGAGAALVTTLFADRLKAWYSAHGAPPTCGGS